MKKPFVALKGLPITYGAVRRIGIEHSLRRDPARVPQHNTYIRSRRSKPDMSTSLRIGHFYFAPTSRGAWRGKCDTLRGRRLQYPNGPPISPQPDLVPRSRLLNFARRTYIRSEGFNADVFQGKPVIGICNSWSELNNCNLGLREVAEAVKRGVWAAGGFPLEFPTISLGETFMRPTTMLFRNLMAMDVEESIRANPLDGVVLLCGCDKTTPAQLMGAASADIPAIVVPGGPMFAGNWRGKRIASGTDGRKLFDLYRAGKLTDEELNEIEGCVSRTVGHCTVMGTASTMTNLAEALGMTLPGCAAIPAPDARRKAIAELSGRRIVEMVDQDVRPSRIMTRAAFENAVTTLMALGGSTNAVVHLIAIAGRLGVPLTLDDFDRLFAYDAVHREHKPSGEYLMEDFFHSGGLPALLRNILPLLHGDAHTVNGKSLGENIENAQTWNRRSNPAAWTGRFPPKVVSQSFEATFAPMER